MRFDRDIAQRLNAAGDNNVVLAGQLERLEFVCTGSVDRNSVVVDVYTTPIKHDLDVITGIGANLSCDVRKIDTELVAQNIDASNGYPVNAVVRKYPRHEYAAIFRTQAQLVHAAIVEHIKDVIIVK